MYQISDSTAMKVAGIVSENSICTRKKVGAVLVKEGNIVAMGFNFVPKHATGKCDPCVRQDAIPGIWDGTQPSCEVIHAEIHVLINALRSNTNINGSTMFITYVPCVPCAGVLTQTKIKEVVYKYGYAGCKRALEILEDAGIGIRQVL